MKINWKLRFQNKVTLLAFLVSLVGFLYQVLSMLGITVPISEDQIMQLIGLILTFLSSLGIIIDPTTKGISDSERALTYDKPK